jgi:hypothetical protein
MKSRRVVLGGGGHHFITTTSKFNPPTFHHSYRFAHFEPSSLLGHNIVALGAHPSSRFWASTVQSCDKDLRCRATHVLSAKTALSRRLRAHFDEGAY